MTVAIATCDPTVPVMDTQFSALIAANLTATIDGFLLGFEVAAGATGSTRLTSHPLQGWARHGGYLVFCSRFFSLRFCET